MTSHRAVLNSDQGRPITMSVHGKETVPESWEELEGSARPSSNINRDLPSQPLKRPVEPAAQMIWGDSPLSRDEIAFVAGQTPYVPQITKILSRPPKPETDGQSAGPTKDTDRGNTVLTLGEKQRRYAEARRRIFTEEASKK